MTVILSIYFVLGCIVESNAENDGATNLREASGTNFDFM
jgi:hypothetical protein